MCEFISWIEKRDKVFFLTGKQVFHTRIGKEVIQKQCGLDDYTGHGAIRLFYGLEQDEGMDKECTDFSTPDNFPAAIVRAIKKGDMRGLGTAVQLLSELAWVEHERIEQSAWVEYKKIVQPALAKCERIEQSAWVEYKKIVQPALAKCERIEHSTLVEHKRIVLLAWVEYERTWRPALVEYKKTVQQVFWDLFAILENRNYAWK